MARRVTKVVGMTPLQALVVNRMREQGWEPKDVEKRGVAHATLHRYMQPTPLKGLPRERVMKELAEALTLNYDQVLEAAMATVAGPNGDLVSRKTWGPVRVTKDVHVSLVVERTDGKDVSPIDVDMAIDSMRSALADEPGYALAARKTPARRQPRGNDVD